MTENKLKILEDLSYIASQKRTVNLITNFRGVPINLSASVIRCSAATSQVRLCVHHRQIISLRVTDQILVQSDLFSEMVIADIDQVDLHSKTINLNNLRYVTGSMGNRKNVRVQPESPLHAEIIASHGFNLLGEVIDISLNGLSIRLDNENLPNDDFLASQKSVEIRFGLPISDLDTIHDLTIQAKIAYTKPSQQFIRIGLLTFLDAPGQEAMRRYIFDRQTAILNEIKQMNNELLEVARI